MQHGGQPCATLCSEAQGHCGFKHAVRAMQGTLLLRRWALNPVLMRQLFQQLNSNDRVQQVVYSRIVVSDPQSCNILGLERSR